MNSALSFSATILRVRLNVRRQMIVSSYSGIGLPRFDSVLGACPACECSAQDPDTLRDLASPFPYRKRLENAA